MLRLARFYLRPIRQNDIRRDRILRILGHREYKGFGFSGRLDLLKCVIHGRNRHIFDLIIAFTLNAFQDIKIRSLGHGIRHIDLLRTAGLQFLVLIVICVHGQQDQNSRRDQEQKDANHKGQNLVARRSYLIVEGELKYFSEILKHH